MNIQGSLLFNIYEQDGNKVHLQSDKDEVVKGKANRYRCTDTTVTKGVTLA